MKTSHDDGDGYSCRPWGYLCSVCRRLFVVEGGFRTYFAVDENIRKTPQKLLLLWGSGGEQGCYLSLIYLCARCVLLVCQIYHGVVPRPKNLSPKGFLNGLSNPLLIYKKAVTPFGVTAFFMAESKGFEPSNRL